MYDLDTTARIHAPQDDPLNGTTAVRVLFTIPEPYLLSASCTLTGIFRLDNDAEISYEMLSQRDQTVVDEACEDERWRYALHSKKPSSTTK